MGSRSTFLRLKPVIFKAKASSPRGDEIKARQVAFEAKATGHQVSK